MPTEEEFRSIFVKKLKYYMDLSGKNQMDLMNAFGLSSSTVSSWCTGKKLPRMNKIQMLADYFHINKSDLLEDKPATLISSSPNAVRIPVVGRVAAGIPINTVEETIDWEEIPESMAKSGEYFGLKIKGDSMLPRICEGDVVIVRKQDDAESDDIVIALINGNEGTCKRLLKYNAGISLISFNPSYAPMNFSRKEIEDLPVRIIGKVVENRQKY